MIRRRSDRTRGQALVEFALIVPLFILLTIGLIDGARAVYAFNTVSNAARQASRVAIVNQDQADIRTAAKTAGVGLGLTDANITLTPCSTMSCEYRVRVTYQFVPVTPGLNAIFRPQLSSSVAMPLEHKNP